jgi:excisionase family DNA binding protein
VRDIVVPAQEAARILHVSRTTLWRSIKEGKISALRYLTKKILIRREELDKVYSGKRETALRFEKSFPSLLRTFSPKTTRYLAQIPAAMFCLAFKNRPSEDEGAYREIS